MAREEYIRIYRSDVAGATPSLTSGEIAANLVDGKLFIGGTNGSLIQFTTDSYSVTGVNGLTGNVSITGDGGAVYGVSNNIIAARVAGYSATGFAAFNSTFFDVGSTGLVSLTGVYVDANGVSGSLQSLSYHEGTTSSISLSIPVRTNLIKHTQDYVTLDFELWNAYGNGSSPTITNLGNVATNSWPNGSTGGIQFAFAANSNNGIYQKWPTGTLQTNTIYTLSCWARSSSGTEKARFSYFDAATNASYYSEDFTLTTVPQRVSYTFRTRSANSSSNIAFGNGSGSATGTVLTWGFQLEEGSVPTSLIPNSTGEAKQGNAQVVSIDLTNRIASASITGVASFDPLHFNIGSTGHVRSKGVITINSLAPDANGNFAVAAATVVTGDGGAVQGKADAFITTRLGSYTLTGIASFDPRFFGIGTSGHLVLTGAYQVTGDTIQAGSAINIGAGKTINNIGVTAFNGLTGSVSLTGAGALFGYNNNTIGVRLGSYTLTGVASFDPRFFGIGTSGHLVLTGSYQVTGDTIQAGSAINIGTGKVINNIGVTAFNGLTGGVSLTGDGGAVQGKLNNTITARLTTAAGATGLASFRDTHFLVDGTGHVQLAAAYQATGDTVITVAGSGIGIVTSGKTDTLYNIGVTSFNGLTGNVSLTGDGGAVQGKLNNSITVRVVGDNAMTGVASFDAAHFTVAATGHVRSKGVITINSQAPDANGNFTVAAATVVTGDGGAIQGKGDAFITARLSSYTLTGVASYDPRFFGIGSTGHLVLTGAYQVTGDTVQAGSGIVIGTGKVITNSGVTGVTTGTLSYGQAGVNGIRVSSLTGNIVIENTGVRALTVQGYTAVTTPTWYQKGPQIRSSSGISVVADWDNELTFLDPYINISNTGVLTVNGLASAVTLTGDGGAVYGVSNDTIAARRASYTLTGVASFDPRFFGIGSTGHLVLTGSYAVTGDTVVTVSGSGIGIVTSGNTETLYNIGVTSFNGLTGNVSLTGDGGAVQGKLNNSITVRVVADNAMTGIASFDASHFTVATTGHVRSKGVITINSLAPDENGNFSIGAATVVTGDGGAIQGKGNAFITARLGSYTLTGVASYDPRFFGIGTSGHLVLTGSYQVTGDTIQAGSAINIGTGKIINNIGVTSFNGLTGNVSLTGDGGAVQGKLNNSITTRLATAAGATGLASFRDTHFLVDGTGHVQLAAAYQVTGQTVVAGYGIDLVASGNTRTINNRGVTSFNGLTGNVSLTGDGGAVQGKLNNSITVRVVADNAMTGVASFRNTHFLVDATGHVQLATAYQATGQTVVAGYGIDLVASGNTRTINNRGVTSFNGLTGNVSLTGDGNGAIQGKENNKITARLATYSLTGVAYFDSTAFIVTDGYVQLNGGGGANCTQYTTQATCEANGCVWCSNTQTCTDQFCSLFSVKNNGIGVSANADGSLAYLYFDAGNLTYGSTTTIDPVNDFVLFYDASQAGLVKTKRIKAERLLLDNDTIFNSKSTQFVKSKSSTNIEFEVLTAPVTQGETKLLESGDAFTYIAQNTVRTLNGATGNVAVVGTINGCTGAIVITGTTNEIMVTNSCPNITIGLPDNVSIPFLSGTGATFTQTVTANRFVGSMDGGYF